MMEEELLVWDPNQINFKEEITKNGLPFSAAPFYVGGKYFVSLLISLPIGDGLCLLIKADITLMAGGLNLAFCQSLANDTALFLDVGAILKAALIKIGSKFRETALKHFLAHQFHLIHIEGRETGRVGYQRITHTEKFHMTSGMAATAELFTHITGSQREIGIQRIQNAGFTNA